MANDWDLRCVCIPAPNVPGAGCKARCWVQSTPRIQNTLNLRCVHALFFRLLRRDQKNRGNGQIPGPPGQREDRHARPSEHRLCVPRGPAGRRPGESEERRKHVSNTATVRPTRPLLHLRCALRNGLFVCECVLAPV